MNYYLIWTNEGWLKTPTYNHVICSGVVDIHLYTNSTVNTTHDILYAYKLNKDQANECLVFLHGFGVASWAVEYKEDFSQDVLKELKQKSERSEQCLNY